MPGPKAQGGGGGAHAWLQCTDPGLYDWQSSLYGSHITMYGRHLVCVAGI